ncbi:unnamed protein product [Linum tenue]|nr:unnamed protein product [Linum tenue]
MVVWVQLPGFPVHFYHKEILFSIGNMIGRSIKLDYHTQNQQRTKFARLAVEVDLAKPLVPRIRLDGKWQKVEFENLPTVCFECGRVGHTKVTCPQLHQPRLPATQTGGSPPLIGAGESETPEVSGGFGPWMIVTRRSRRNQRELPNQEMQPITNGADHENLKAQKGKAAQQQESAEGNSPRQEAVNSRQYQRSPNQNKSSGNREGDNLRRGKEGNGKNKGKEKVDSNGSAGGKGVLGSGPSGPISSPKKPTLDKDKGEASSSKVQEIGLDGHNMGPKDPKPSWEGARAAKAHVHNGPKGTAMRIVEASPYPSLSAKTETEVAPSATARIRQRKKQNKEEGRGNRASPSKAMSVRKNPSKALQIWSPKKEKKSKLRERRVSVTLQQIEE